MRVFRGRAESIDADRDVSRRLLSVAADGDPAVRVWTPHRQVAFGRRDARREGYDRAREFARERGFPPVERDVGGRAVAYDGTTTLAFARAEPVADLRTGTTDRYERATAALERALRTLGLEPVRGEPDDSFCPGTHSLSVAVARTEPKASADGAGDDETGAPRRKLVGIAQRVRSDAALTAGIALVANREELADVLDEVYGALDVPFDPSSVGTVADAGGPSDPETVRTAIEESLIGDATDVSVVSAGDRP
ncbi:lipoyl protein ligase domain-containing protein [Natrinema salifodinae]|uniref:Lipoate-protein ligase A n=1 Tax=Natrinema salifodinae TaxID=1202768 RepID=A0A1I0Q2U1_9EURY|nr:lipoate--protein ligase family protein [Natrinema salifodinae]SEW21190.1 Lipoate-protein ligase A [Natrinema salifodinae]